MGSHQYTELEDLRRRVHLAEMRVTALENAIRALEGFRKAVEGDSK